MWTYYKYLVEAIGLSKVDAYKLTMEKYGYDLRS